MSDDRFRRIDDSEIEKVEQILREPYVQNPRLKFFVPAQIRLMKFRRDHPDGQIQTDVVLEDGQFIARARVSVPRDGSWALLATGTKAVPAKLQNSCERAETGAVGRALALCGYGMTKVDESDSTSGAVQTSSSPISDRYDVFSHELENAPSFERLDAIAAWISGQDDLLDDERLSELRKIYSARREQLGRQAWTK